ncbi:hypothetical protein Btru_045876 [Bulinus truncatus]|nr:hypothetical protein Btru_045876 [Bulinus truncatus]
MDGQAVNNGDLGAAFLENLDDKESGSETKSFEADLEQLHIIDDDFEQPDGQRSSLSLDDDGGTHFDVHSQDGVIRRGGSLRETNISPSLQGISEDNDILFNPLQRLNFDDDDYVDDDEGENQVDDNGIDDGIEVPDCGLDNDSLDDRDYLHHRPAVHGSDLTEQGAYGGVLVAHDQGQNIRIIEGHDSSLLDDGGNSPYGFSFLHTQMVQIPVMSPVNSNVANSNRLEEDSHNLYDSLEREDGPNQYSDSADTHGHVLENNTSEYFSAGSMNLMSTNSQTADNELLWAQDESSENDNYLTHSQQHYQHSSEQQSPPRNFQVDPSGIFVAKRRGTSFLSESNLGGYGDSHSNEEDNTDALSIELSEEGLLQNTQTYAQPVSSIATVNGAVHHLPAQKEWSAWSQPSSIAQASGFDLADPFRGSQPNSQPKNLARSQAPFNVNMDLNSEGDGLDTQDKRQAGAGSSTTVNNQNQSAVEPKLPKKSLNSKVQLRRPAVQGSASSGDTRKTVVVNQRPPLQNNVTAVKKTSSFCKSGNLVDKSSKGNGGIIGQKNRPEPAKGVTVMPMPSSCPQPKPSLDNMSMSGHISLISTNSRVSGVGKESHLAVKALSARAANQSPTTDNSNISTLQRDDSLQGEFGISSSNLSNTANSLPTHHLQASQSFDRIRPSAGQNHSELRASQSFNKPQSASGSLHTSAQNLTVASDHTMGPSAHLLPPHPADFRRLASASTSLQESHQAVNPQHRDQTQQVLHSGFGASLQRSHSGFPVQAPINLRESASLESNHYPQNRVVLEGFKWQNTKSSQHSGPALVQHAHINSDIQGMEEVRNQLQNVLVVGTDSACASVTDHVSFDHSDTVSEIFNSDQQVKRHLHFDTDLSSLIGNSQDDMSDILENFPTFSSKMFLEMSSITNRNETSVYGENQYLRDSLEKEKYRRKHCEEHIQKLNAKLLEVQQQLAVAISTDKRKDLMIEQLDRQLAKVVEGWKKREIEKDEFLKVVTHEKEQIEETLQSQQNMINSFERELAQTVEQLRSEKERSNEIIHDLKEELKEYMQEKQHAEKMLDSERQKFAGVLAEWKDITESRDKAEKRAQQAEEKLLEEQQLLSKTEQEFLTKINEVKEANQKVINMEKIKLEEQKKKMEEVMAERDELKTELKKIALDLEQLIREKESQKVEMAILEAKFETAQRKLEADLHAQMEKEIADQASEFHTRIETALEAAADRHHKQVSELQSQHQRDLERHATTMNEERLKREEEHRKQICELEEKLQVMRTENHSLRQSKIKLESQRVEILTKLQFMMQSQWNEAVSLLVSTPQKKSLNSSFMSSHAGSGHSGPLAPVMPAPDINTPVTSLNLVTSVPFSSTAQGLGTHAVETTSLPETKIVQSGSETETLDRGEELNRMNRVEEYLQQLNQHMELPPNKSDAHVSDVNNSPDYSAYCSTNTSGKVTHSFSTSGSDYLLQQQHKDHALVLPEFRNSLEYRDREEYLNKPSNNLNQSQLPRVHGYITGQSGKTIITSVGPTITDHSLGGQTIQDLSFQALPMRSPQQSSSRFNPDLSHQSGRSETDSGANHQLVTSNGHHPFTPPQQHPHSMNYPHHQQHECQKQQSSPLPASRHNQNTLFSNGQSCKEGRQLTGDFGDQRTHKVASIVSGDKNLYSPDSPTCSSSPSVTHSDHWSPGNAASARPFYVNNAGNTLTMQSPVRNHMTRSIEGMESPVKKYKPRAGQTLRITGSLNDSLSPPVKQTSNRLQHDDNMSDADGSINDPDRQ